ncbi:MAG TPA: hypothetical protein VFA28_17750 [Bryobacteraceae bacterium]|nr:hypothetical protein [Bryobacteraceae bacterium]
MYQPVPYRTIVLPCYPVDDGRRTRVPPWARRRETTPDAPFYETNCLWVDADVQTDWARTFAYAMDHIKWWNFWHFCAMRPIAS